MCVRLPFIPWSIVGAPSSQALPGFLITAPPPVLVPAVLSVLAVWIQNQKKIKEECRSIGLSALILGHGHDLSFQQDTCIVSPKSILHELK